MNGLPNDADRLLYLSAVVCDKSASQAELAELDAVLIADSIARRRFLDYCHLHFSLELEMRAHCATQNTLERIDPESGPSAAASDCIAVSAKPFAQSTSLLFSSSASTGFQVSQSYLSSGWPLAYLIATVIFGIGAIIGTFTHVSQPAQVVHESASFPLLSPLSPP